MGECGVCQQPAVWIATVPMCGERPRFPLCESCLNDLAWSGYAERIVLASTEASDAR